MTEAERIRVLTYNIRKGKGADGRSSVPMTELGSALRAHPIDLVLCQEVFHCARTGSSQSSHLAHELGFDPYYGANKFREVGHHGNTTLTRLPVSMSENHDISTNRIERRGALYTCVSLKQRRMHVFNVHLGLNRFQRQHQIERVHALMVERCKPEDAVLLAGDFNDWQKRLDPVIKDMLGLHNVFEGQDERSLRTWHAQRPMFNLDRIYVRGLEAHRAERLSGDPWTSLSDHLPLWAELVVSP